MQRLRLRQADVLLFPGECQKAVCQGDNEGMWESARKIMKVKTEMIVGGVKVITNKTHEISEFF